VRDYRDLRPGAYFAKVASIGMLEHVGREQMAAYFAAALRVTRPGGLFLAHGIVDQAPVEQGGQLVHAARRLWGEGRFIERYVFPDGELLRPWELARAADHAGWELCDAENLSEHYALTLRHWVRRLEAAHAAVVAATDETTYRIWRLYMSASAYSFATGKLGVVQYLLSRHLPDGTGRVPLTRADLYR
jgi:cyclopropane-fatty-acyl-phospholipid synthase